MPSLPAPNASFAQSDAGAPPLRVIVAYDERSAYRRAMRLLANAFCDEFQSSDIRPLPWRFDELALAPWRKHATTDAAQADVFVVAASNELPDGVKEWLQDCFALRRAQPTAIVLLSPDRPEKDNSECACRQFLRQAATAAGVDFIDPHLAVGPLAAASA